jgi:hypothetical protein
MIKLGETDWVGNKEKIWIIQPQEHTYGGQLEILNASFQLEKELKYPDTNTNAALYTRKHADKEGIASPYEQAN